VKGAEALADLLAQAGVDTIFGLPGSTEASLLEALRARNDVRYVLGLHEGPVVSMADGYARVTGKPGVACLHTTVGSLNGASQVYNAFQDGSPVVVLAGHKDRTVLSESGFCSHPHLPEAFRPFTKWSHQALAATELGCDVWRALHVAMTAPTGPTYLAVPEDFLRGQVPADSPVPPAGNVGLWSEAGPAPAESVAAAAAQLLSSARSPVILIGSQARGCVAELRAISDQLAAPLVCADFTDLADVPFPTSDDRYLGLTGEDPAVFDGCDLVLCVGARLFYPFSTARHPALPPGARLIHVHPDAGQIGRRVATDVGIASAPSAALRAIVAQLGTAPAPPDLAQRSARIAALRTARDARRQAERAAHDSGPMPVDRLAAELNQVLPADAVIVDEGVRSATRLLRHLDLDDSQLMLRSSGGALGWGVPAAIGASIGAPGRPVVALVGDGSYQFSVQAIWSAVQQQASVVIVVLDNGGYLAVKRAIESYLGVPNDPRLHPGTRLPQIDHVAIAQGYGAAGQSIQDAADVGGAVKAALDAGGVQVIAVTVAEVRP
jgi:benzoylformate decarboxylase